MTKTTSLSNIVQMTTQHGYTISYIPDYAPEGIVQFAYNGAFKFAIPMTDLMEIVEAIKHDEKL